MPKLLLKYDIVSYLLINIYHTTMCKFYIIAKNPENLYENIFFPK